MVSEDGLSLWRSHTTTLEILAAQLSPLSLFSHSRLSTNSRNPTQTVLSPDLLVLLILERMKRILLGSQRGLETVESGV